MCSILITFLSESKPCQLKQGLTSECLLKILESQQNYIHIYYNHFQK